MGTRNITRVKSGGQLKVCQYCQWDGYPTGAGAGIIEFIRKSDDDRMRQRLDHVTLDKVTEEGVSIAVTGAPWTDGMSAISHDEWDFRDAARATVRRKSPDADFHEEYDLVNAEVRRMLAEKYGESAIREYELAVRDTGYSVLDIIYGCDDDVTAWTQDYLIGNDGDWQIEGVWELDYDLSKLTGFWHGERREWTFDQLRAMSEDEVVTEMVSFERSDYEEE